MGAARGALDVSAVREGEAVTPALDTVPRARSWRASLLADDGATATARVVLTPGRDRWHAGIAVNGAPLHGDASGEDWPRALRHAWTRVESAGWTIVDCGEVC